MKHQSLMECETNKLNKSYAFQLSHRFKKIGYYVAFGTFGLMIAKKFIDEPEWVKSALRVLLLIGMLIISMSKDKVEDEFIDSLRSKSYRLAFIMGVLYALIQPLINFAVSSLLAKEASLSGFDYFQVLFFMLLVQLMMFWQLKKFYQ